MAIRSGLGGQLGIATEAEYGVFVEPSTFLFIESESLDVTLNEQETFPLRAGVMVQAGNLHTYTTKTVEGDITLPFTDQGMGKILNTLHGEEVSPEKQEVKSEEQYKQVHPIGESSPFGKSFTGQVGLPETSEGESLPAAFLGLKVMKASFAVETDGDLMATLSLDGRDVNTEEGLVEAEYDADTIPFRWQDCEVKVGGEKVANVLSGTLDIEIPHKVDRYFLGNGQLKSEPIPNAPLVVTFSGSLEFQSLGDYERYTGEAGKALAFNAVGSEIGEEEEHFEALFAMPEVKQTSSGLPQLSGPDVLTSDVTFKATANGTEAPLTITYNSTDSAL